MKIKNPYNQKEIGEIALMDKDLVQNKLKSAILAKEKLTQLSAAEKSNILLHIVKGIKRRKDEFIDTIVKESGKPYKYALREVNRALQTFTIASEECKRLPHELIDLDASLRGKNLRGELVYFPKGIALGIAPFNFPLNLVAHKVAPSIAAGCPILLKPSERTPLTAELLKEIISTSELPKGGFEIIHCEKETTMDLVTHPEIDILSFTGSAKVGWKMKSLAGRKKVVLELGGNAAAILAEDANLKLAVEELLVGSFAYSGQVCIHTQRIYVHDSLFTSFCRLFVQGVEQLEVGDPAIKTTDFGIMIDEENAIRVEKWVNEAIDSGATCLIGGSRIGSFYAPTVLTNVAKGQKVRDDEVFGPVVMIEPFTNVNDAIREVNDTEWGLQASIFTNNIEIRDLCFQKILVGELIHNKSTTFRVDEMSYGGVKNSGFGREGIHYALLDYLEPKLLVRKF